MDLKVKYSRLISYAQQEGVNNLAISENDNVLRITGTASQAVKDKLWDIYEEIDPEMRSGDLVLNIQLGNDSEIYEVKSGDNLSKIANNYPGMTWKKIYEANKDQISDPNMIHPGQKLKIPTA